MAEWVQREHSKGEIDKAGALLVPWWKSMNPQPFDGLGQAYVVIQNWRTSHAFPLNTFQVSLRTRARRIEPGALVAQRLKRFSSVMNKLAREPQMKLSQMQDLGGCRAIVSSVEAVDRLFDLYRGSPTLFEQQDQLKSFDYIRNPKHDGYRGVHVVGRFHARAASREPWNAHRIEVQLRSRLQHAFATAVETVTTFTRAPLKFGAGPAEWRRFFSLMGSVLAMREGTPLVSGTPTSRVELLAELRDSSRKLRVRQRLRGWANALQTMPQRNIRDFKWLLLVLNTSENTIKVTGYHDRQKADKAVADLEQMKRDDIDAVLVWVRSVRDLRKAYPNYYADTREFIDALAKALHS